MSDYEKEKKAERKKIENLRALRLEKEAVDREEAAREAKAKASAKKKTAAKRKPKAAATASGAGA